MTSGIVSPLLPHEKPAFKRDVPYKTQLRRGIQYRWSQLTEDERWFYHTIVAQAISQYELSRDIWGGETHREFNRRVQKVFQAKTFIRVRGLNWQNIPDIGDILITPQRILSVRCVDFDLWHDEYHEDDVFLYLVRSMRFRRPMGRHNQTVKKKRRRQSKPMPSAQGGHSARSKK